MKVDGPKTWKRLLAITIAATAALALLGACGDDDEEGEDGGGVELSKLALQVTEKDGTSALQAPSSAEAGPTEITLTNNGKKPHDSQFILAEGNRTAQQVIDAFGKAVQGGSLPEWLLAAGGTPVVEPGQSARVVQVLGPGTYYVFDIEGSPGPPEAKSVPVIAVSGAVEDAELPEVDATVTAFEYGFEAEGLSAGSQEIRFVNQGAQPHHIVAAPLRPGKDIADVERFVKQEKGPPPVDLKAEVTTAVLEGGTEQNVTLDLPRPGTYALLCFITDRQGGPPHVVKGMIAEAKVG